MLATDTLSIYFLSLLYSPLCLKLQELSFKSSFSSLGNFMYRREIVCLFLNRSFGIKMILSSLRTSAPRAEAFNVIFGNLKVIIHDIWFSASI